MQKAHDPSKNNAWKDYPDITTPILAAELNRNETSVDTIDDRVVAFDTTKANQSDLLTTLADVTFNSSNGKFTFTKKNGSTVEIDTDIEKIAINFDYDDDPTSAHYQQLVITLDDGTVKYVDMSALVTQYEFTDSSQIHFTITNGVISATVIQGSITENMLQPNFLADCRSAKNAAETAESGAEGSAEDAEAWAVGTRNGVPVGPTDPAYENSAEYWAHHGSNSLAQLTDVDVTGTQNNDVLTYDNASSKWKNEHTAPVTLTGNPVTFTTNSEQVARSTKVTLSPIQAGSGDPSPSNPRAISGYDKVEVAVPRKNLIKGFDYVGTYDNSGAKETQASWDYVVTEKLALEIGETYCISNTVTFNEIKLSKWKADGTFIGNESPMVGQSGSYSGSFTVPSGVERVAITIRLDNYISSLSSAGTPQLELGSTATTYEPYNPITDITESLPNTIYGGELDVESGVLKVTHGLLRIDDASLTWNKSINEDTPFFYTNVPGKALKKTDAIFSCFKYDGNPVASMVNNTFKGADGYTTIYVKVTDYSDVTAFKTALGSQTFAYELANPYTIQLTPHQVSLLKGANTVLSNGTSMEITYRNGTIATLEDVESVAETVDKVAELVDGTKPASKITAGTFAGKVRGNQTAMAVYSDLQFRDIKITDTAPTIGGAATEPNGTIIIVYE